MANPTEISDEMAVLEATTTEQTVTLDPEREYTLGHDGEDTAGAAAASTIYLAAGAAVATVNPAAGINKCKLLAMRTVVIGPGIVELRYVTASGAPTFSVIPGRRI